MPTRYPHPEGRSVETLRAEQVANRAAIARSLEQLRQVDPAGTAPRHKTGTLLAILAASVLGFAGGVLVTREPSTTPPGAGAPVIYEDGSWRMTGCLPGAPCDR